MNTLAVHDWLATLDSYANHTYGRPIGSAVVDGACVGCGQRARPFITAEAALTYARVGLCGRCQEMRRASTSNEVVPFTPRRGDADRFGR